MLNIIRRSPQSFILPSTRSSATTLPQQSDALIFPSLLVQMISTQRCFSFGGGGGSDNNNGKKRRSLPPRVQERNAQLENLFKSKSRHEADRARTLSMESDAKMRPQHAAATHRTGRVKPVAVSLLEMDEEDEGLFPSQEQQQGGSIDDHDDALVAASVVDKKGDSVAALLGGSQQQQDQLPATAADSVLIDDDFAYLPEVKPEQAVPGESLVPPGLTRMRVDVQFRGDHFFGWNRQAERILSNKKKNGVAAATDDMSSNESGGGDTSSSNLLHQQAQTAAAVLARSVKNALEEALLIALDLDKFPSPEGVVASCILETGVHCRRLACHVDIPSDILMQPRTVLQRAHVWLNKCSDPLAILSFTPAPRGFHARHSVRRRVFVYRMLNRVAPPLFELGTQWHVDRSLDIGRMNEACKMLEGRQDFTAFADPKIIPLLLHSSGRRGNITSNNIINSKNNSVSVSGGVRELESVHVTRQEDEVFIWFVGRAFLRHQLRTMASVLKLVGQGLWDDDILEQFMRGPGELAPQGQGVMSWRHLQPTPAPAHGLWLWNAEYSDTPGKDASNSVVTDSGPVASHM